MSTTDRSIDRRDFLRRVGGAGAGLGLGFAFPTIIPARAFGAADRIRIGQIGVGNQGGNNLKALMEHTVAVCDVDAKHLTDAKQRVEKENGRSCAAFRDYRKVLDAKDIDAVVVSTPDHWHALPTIDACMAGKDVYTEKPLTHSVREGQAMVEAARQHGRIVQTGSQQRSNALFRQACELVRNGKLGKLEVIRVGLSGVNFEGPAVPDASPPPELDYDFWSGPAPLNAYNPKHVHYNFRFFWDYAGGQLTNWGAHHLDIVQWALGRDESGPVSVDAKPVWNKDGWYQVPESSETVFTYDDGTRVVCQQGMKERSGVTFVGEKGTLYITRGKIECDPAEILETKFGPDDTRLYESENHHQNWLECIKSRKPPICDVAIGHRSATLCHLANISCRVGRKLNWDPNRQVIVGDSEAAEYLLRPYRSPWNLKGSIQVGSR